MRRKIISKTSLITKENFEIVALNSLSTSISSCKNNKECNKENLGKKIKN
jgi:hypothetical protein